MDYNINALDPLQFEHLIQSLSKKILGHGAMTFGDGPDGGREATFDGKAPFPSSNSNWSGYWVIQAKFKTVNSEKESTDYNWLKMEIAGEMKKYQNSEVRKPTNLLIFTNIRLTAARKAGTLDKCLQMLKEYERKSKIKNIRVVSYDDLRDLLDGNRDIATAYSSFILSGDILMKLFKLLETDQQSGTKINLTLSRFLESEFKDFLPSKLEHAGKVTTDKVNLERVFVDLKVKRIALDDRRDSEFVKMMLGIGNSKYSDSKTIDNKVVLVAGPGYGKSTLTQFLCQIYRANFLSNIDATSNSIFELNAFISSVRHFIDGHILTRRFPFQIILKDFAEWIQRQQNIGKDYSVISYICYRISVKSFNEPIEVDVIVRLLQTLSFIFVFDGLDEVPASSNRSDVLNEIRAFLDDLRRYRADYVAVGTTRPKGYSNDFDERKFVHFSINDLNQSSCMEYVDRLLETTVSDSDNRSSYRKIIERAYSDAVVGLLMRSPLQISIMAILVQSGGDPPRNKYDLFQEYYATVLRREKQKGVVRILTENPIYVEDIHNYLGFYLQALSESEENASASISTEQFEQIVVEYLRSIGVNEEIIRRYAIDILNASKERLAFISEVQDGRIGFAIRSFQEYFAANYYLMNQQDDLIPDRLFRIGVRSYWSNTFLFSLGYLAKHKRYLIYSIDSLCKQCNEESIDKVGDQRINFICRFGSWLALDILNEGVFRALPNHENVFIQYLYRLFELPYSNKHNEICKLPKAIIERILPVLQQNLRNSYFESQVTSWLVIYDLFQNGFSEVFSLIFSNWPKADENSETLLKELIKRSNIFDIWTLDKLQNQIVSNPHGDVVVFLFQERGEVLTDLASYALLNFDARAVLLGRSLLLAISGTSPRFIDELIYVLTEGSVSRNPDWRRWFDNYTMFELVDDYVVSFRTINGKLSSDTILVDDMIPANQNDFLKLIIEFIKTPKFEILERIVSAIDSLSAYEVSYVRGINWLFDQILYPGKKPKVELKHFTDVSKWRAVDRDIARAEVEQIDSIDLMKFCQTHFYDGGEPIYALGEFYTRYYLSAKGSEQSFSVAAEAFVKLAGVCSELIIEDKEVLDASIQDALIDSVDVLCLQRGINEFGSELISVIALLSEDKLDYFVSANASLFAGVDFENLDFFDIDDLVARQAMVNTIGAFVRTGVSEIIPLILSLHLHQITFVGESEYVALPFGKLMEVKCSEHVENYKCMLLLYDKSFSDEHYQMVAYSLESIVKNCRRTLGNVFQADQMRSSDLMIMVIIQLHHLKVDDVITSDFVREYIERQPSGINVDDFNFV